MKIIVYVVKDERLTVSSTQASERAGRQEASMQAGEPESKHSGKVVVPVYYILTDGYSIIDDFWKITTHLVSSFCKVSFRHYCRLTP